MRVIEFNKTSLISLIVASIVGLVASALIGTSGPVKQSVGAAGGSETTTSATDASCTVPDGSGGDSTGGANTSDTSNTSNTPNTTTTTETTKVVKKNVGILNDVRVIRDVTVGDVLSGNDVTVKVLNDVLDVGDVSVTDTVDVGNVTGPLTSTVNSLVDVL